MIESGLPTHWKDLEESVARILRECGFHVEVGKSVKSARGSVEFDVYARDGPNSPPVTLIVECKHWGRAVPQGEVHKFRTTMADVGANIGFLVSSTGFQSGARDAALYSNIRLVDWEEFQSAFVERWYQHFMLEVIREEARRVIEYAGGSSFGFMMEVFPLPQDQQVRVMDLASKHANIARLAASLLRFEGSIVHGDPRVLQLPLRSSYEIHLKKWSPLPDEVLDAPVLRSLLMALVSQFRKATSDFDTAMLG
jgi:restriction system protein